jgi:murein DD-endopeptidase MepM/ murein hydrolase activator NlpD
MADPLAHRPNFLLPFPKGAKIHLQTYRGHNPDDKKIDMYREGMKIGSDILASAAGLVHEQFDPGGIEINHGNGWFTVYLHMSKRAAIGTRVQQGEWVGEMGSVGTEFPHLHYEQLFVGAGAAATDADTGNMVNALIQGVGPLTMVVDHPVIMTSTNAEVGAHPLAVAPTPLKLWVDTFSDAPVFATPNDTRQTGTLKRGRNYVFGRRAGREIRVGPNFNHFWMKTDPDVGHGEWVSAYYLANWGNDIAKDNDGRDLPDV